MIDHFHEGEVTLVVMVKVRKIVFDGVDVLQGEWLGGEFRELDESDLAISILVNLVEDWLEEKGWVIFTKLSARSRFGVGFLGNDILSCHFLRFLFFWCLYFCGLLLW